MGQEAESTAGPVIKRDKRKLAKPKAPARNAEFMQEAFNISLSLAQEGECMALLGVPSPSGAVNRQRGGSDMPDVLDRLLHAPRIFAGDGTSSRDDARMIQMIISVVFSWCTGARCWMGLASIQASEQYAIANGSASRAVVALSRRVPKHLLSENSSMVRAHQSDGQTASVGCCTAVVPVEMGGPCRNGVAHE